MTSDFFYLPANQKATEEQRVKFTQERLALVSEWISHDFVRTRPGKYSYADLSGNILFWKIIITDDRKVLINRNWWNMATDLFCSEHRCKLAEIDILYLTMKAYQALGFDVRPADCSLAVTLFEPNT